MSFQGVINRGNPPDGSTKKSHHRNSSFAEPVPSHLTSLGLSGSAERLTQNDVRENSINPHLISIALITADDVIISQSC
jgi:hypothetical protein